MASESGKTASKACHNCRRRRLRCDRSYPHCNKCLNAGAECLGYGKLFRWIGAVASRGKLAGRTSYAPDDDDASRKPRSNQGAVTITSKKQHALSVSCQGVKDRQNKQLVCQQLTPDSDPPLMSWCLVDPIYQDIDPSHRRYLDYFTQRLCSELIPRDSTNPNPFFNLLPLSKSHPLLHHTIVAVSAAHMSNLIKPRVLPSGEPNTSPTLPGTESSARNAKEHALTAKHKALSLMRDAVQHMDQASGDVVLAAVVFFINLELIESGKHAWKAHVRAASQIASLLPPAHPGNAELRELIISDSIVYYIMASAFIPDPALDHSSFHQPAHLHAMLHKAASYGYNCCPADLLAIIYEGSQLCSLASQAENQDDVLGAALALINRAQLFDAEAWARDESNFCSSRTPCLQTRIHAASAYQLAICIYIIRGVPALSERRCYDEMTSALSSGVLHHVTSIPESDPSIKIVTWPTFIVGADTRDPFRREWVMQKMRFLASSCPWGFLYTAMDMLEKLWAMDTPDSYSRCWVKTLKEAEANFVVV